MPRGVYSRKKKLGQILFTDTTRLDLLESEETDIHIYKPRFVGESVVVRAGPYMGQGVTLRAALDNLSKHR